MPATHRRLRKIPHSVPAVTVNRLWLFHAGAARCGPYDHDRRRTGLLVGGVEHMGHVPMSHGVDFHPGMSRNVAKAAAMMGLTGEMLSRTHGISREMQDAFAARSHARAGRHAVGASQNETIRAGGHDADGVLKQFTHDEVIRPETTVEALRRPEPAFPTVTGTVTAAPLPLSPTALRPCWRRQ
ncbi:hypothetical protein ACNKHQ_22735 [Shigella flexneri]